MSLFELMASFMSLPFDYYLPVTAGFLYILNDVFYCIDENFIYKFKSKKDWIKDKVFSSILISILYVSIVYFIISFIFQLKLNLTINSSFFIYSFISIILSSLVYIIYSVFCIIIYLLFRNKKNISISFVYTSIIALIIAGTFSDVSQLPNNLILYNFSNFNRLILIDKNFISAIFLLSIILFILLECVYIILDSKDF